MVKPTLKTTLSDFYGNPISSLTQWDSNVTLYINNWGYDSAPIIHFLDRPETKSCTVQTTLEEVNGNKRVVLCVPNIMLQGCSPINLFIALQRNKQTTESEEIGIDNNTEIKVLYKEEIKVQRRKQPDDYIYEDNVEFIQLEEVLEDLEDAIAAFNLKSEELQEYMDNFERRAEDGEFDGKDGKDGIDGKDGVDGQDGFSPLVTVTEGVGTHQVTITDVQGDHDFSVNDGKDGKDGAQGISPVLTITQSGQDTIFTVVDATGTKITTLSIPRFTAGSGISIVNGVISATLNWTVEVYNSFGDLPLTGQERVFYFVRRTTTSTKDIFDEYVWVNNDYELIGNTQVDLSGYLTKTEATEIYQEKLTVGNQVSINQNNEISAFTKVVIF